jgi:hypothetical protein
VGERGVLVFVNEGVQVSVLVWLPDGRKVGALVGVGVKVGLTGGSGLGVAEMLVMVMEGVAVLVLVAVREGIRVAVREGV